MRLLVTGGAGFIGSNFIHYWLKNRPDDAVVNYDVLTYAGNLENLQEIENDPRYTFMRGDIGDYQSSRRALDGIDVVVNFAAESHVDRSITGPAEFIKTNVSGTQTLLDAAVAAGIKRFHHISTDEVFGSLDLGSTEKFTSQTMYNPSSPYSASKAASDHLVRAYHKTFGLPVTITNCSNNYGPYQFIEKLIPLMITNAIENKPLPLYGDGLNVRDWIHVEDHCRAIDLVLQKGVIGETYLVGGNAERSNVEVVRSILRLLGKNEGLIERVQDRLGHDRRYAIDSDQIKQQLGFAPRYTFEQGLAETIEWYTHNENWWRRLQTKEYQQYYEKQYAKSA
ncbi:MAG: dTDP-glucose 4,6-dehydratase [bacterium]|nr:dTDP-glucose 4,6-dehydratase [bacterium]